MPILGVSQGTSAGGAFTPEAFGAVGDGVADDTTAIMNADSAARSAGTFVQFGPYAYRCHLTWRAGSTWIGAGTRSSTQQSTRLVGASGTAPVTLDTSAVVYTARMEDIRIEGTGAPAVEKTDQEQHDGLTFNRCALISYDSPGLHVVGGTSGVALVDTQVHGNPYGLDLSIPTGYGAAMDWWTITRGQLGGSSGGLRFRATNAGGHNWQIDRVRFAGGSGHSIWLHAWAKHWTWRNVVASEAQGGGIWGLSETFTTTATATAGQSTATLADVSEIAVGQLLTIRGARSGSSTYEGRITGLAGNVVTLDTPIGTTVTAAECTNAEYDILHCGTSGEAVAAGQPWVGTILQHTFTNCDMGRGSGSLIRFSVSGGRSTFINHESYGAPIRDDYYGGSYINTLAPVWRSGNLAGADEFPVGEGRWVPWLNKTLWSDGTQWRDATGTIVSP